MNPTDVSHQICNGDDDGGGSLIAQAVSRNLFIISFSFGLELQRLPGNKSTNTDTLITL